MIINKGISGIATNHIFNIFPYERSHTHIFSVISKQNRDQVISSWMSTEELKDLNRTIEKYLKEIK